MKLSLQILDDDTGEPLIGVTSSTDGKDTLCFVLPGKPDEPEWDLIWLNNREEAELRKFLNDRAAKHEPNTLFETTLSAVEVGERFWVSRQDHSVDRENTWHAMRTREKGKLVYCGNSQGIPWSVGFDIPVFIEARGV